jgi:thiol-disulfide isomerase/thioredoxin
VKRRSWFYAGAALGAASLGAVSAWWLHRPGGPAAARLASDPFWGASLDTPDGGRLALASFHGKPLLVNFWATWCPPCIEELPLLEAFYQTHRSRGWQMLGIAIDQPSAVRRFLERQALAFPVGLAGLEGTGLAKSLGNTAGGLPFTVFFKKDGSIWRQKMGQLTDQDLSQWRAAAA